MNSECANNIDEKTMQQNQELIERFPFLLPNCGRDDRGRLSPDFDFRFTELDFMPEGWRIAFGEQMCEEIKEALLSSGTSKEEGFAALYEYRILEIKEKYGQLRWLSAVLIQEGLLTEKTYNSFASYCQEWSRYQKQQILINEKGVFMNTKRGEIREAPFVSIAYKALRALQKSATDLGLSKAMYDE